MLQVIKSGHKVWIPAAMSVGSSVNLWKKNQQKFDLT